MKAVPGCPYPGTARLARKRSLSFTLLRVIRGHQSVHEACLGSILEQLGDRSFGWAILLSCLVNLLPLPPGATLITAVPLLIFCGQLSLGFSSVQLPQRIARIRISVEAMRRIVLRLRPISRRLERIARPRVPAVFHPKREQLIGCFLFLVSLALFVPLPLSGWFPAIALFIASIGLVERDGVIVLAGVCAGVFSIALTVFVASSILIGANSLLQ
ncbi:exopolysaccharide biosynthesis protein [Leisingera sp. D0M16]|uniref:exopolysaccharide biosynthesis protein n=1 Tax=Leisingera coralii TaxID=3351347 RepID=UPI003B7AB80F